MRHLKKPNTKHQNKVQFSIKDTVKFSSINLPPWLLLAIMIIFAMLAYGLVHPF